MMDGQLIGMAAVLLMFGVMPVTAGIVLLEIKARKMDALVKLVELGASVDAEMLKLLSDGSTTQIDLEKAMARLKTDEAAAISLCHSVGFSHGEVADILETPLGTVKTHINRGKARLREMLAPPALEQAS